MPTKVVYGSGAIKSIGIHIGKRKALLITSQGFIDRGLISEISEYTNNIVKVISDVKSHPEFCDVERLYNQAHQCQFELIIAIGGGSVIDVAKFISVYNANKEYRFVEGLTKSKVQNDSYKLIPIVAIPTTAGTGSELSPFSTIWDLKEKKKYSLSLHNLFCEVAIYDPVLTLTVPRDVTVQTGLDALSHSLESIWNKNANPITVEYSIKSAKLIMNNLVLLSNNLENIEYRGKIMQASMYAGLAFSNTQTAIAHAISYYVTLHKKVPHGIACSFTLPMLIDNVVGQYGFVDLALKEIFGSLSSDKLRTMLRELGISDKFEEYGIDDSDLEKIRLSIQNNQRAGNSLVSI